MAKGTSRGLLALATWAPPSHYPCVNPVWFSLVCSLHLIFVARSPAVGFCICVTPLLDIYKGVHYGETLKIGVFNMEQHPLYKITFIHGGFWKEVASANRFKYLSGRKCILQVNKETATLHSVMEDFASVSKWAAEIPLLFTYCVPDSRPKKIHLVATDDHLQGLMQHHANSRSFTLHVVVDEVDTSEDEADSEVHILENGEPVVHQLQNYAAIVSQVPEVLLVDQASQLEAMHPSTEEQQSNSKEILDDLHNGDPDNKFLSGVEKSSKVADTSVANIHPCIPQGNSMDPQGGLSMPSCQTVSVEINEGNSDVQDPVTCRRLRKPRKLRSAVWNHMTRQHLGDGIYVVFCNHCKKKMRTMGTTNLKSHLRYCAAFRHSKSSQGNAEMNESAINMKGQELMQIQELCPGLPKRRNRSAVWNDMTKEQREDGSYFATCNHCKKKMVGSSAKGTTHLRNHLRFCAAFRHTMTNEADVGQLLLEPSERKKRSTSTFDFFKFDPERSRQDFAHMLILHEYPFSIVDHIGFRTFLKNLQPQFKLMSQSSILADCVKVYESGKGKILEALDKICSRVSLTASMWTAIGNMQYLCLTCHFIDGDWKLQERILNFVNVKSLHDTDELIEVIKDKISGWHINGKLFSFVLGDSLRNDAALVELFGRSCFWSEFCLDGNFLHMRCFAHLFDLIVSEGLKVKEVSNIVDKIRRTLRHIMKSQASEEGFQRCAQQLGAPEKSLVLDSPTRWDSTYLMLETALEFKNVFSHLPDFDSSNFPLASLTWESVQALVDCLSLFHEVTSRFHSMTHSTITFCFVDLCVLHMKMKEWCDSSSQCIKSMALKMFEKLGNYWGEASMLPAIGSVLDPRFKMKSIDYVFGQVYCDDLFEGYKRVDDVRQAFIKLYEMYSAQYERIVVSHASHGSSSKDGSCLEDECGRDTQPSNRSTLDSMRKGLGRLLREASKVQTQKPDVDLYLEEGVIITEDDDFDVLNWWMQHAERYPILSMMARDVLAVPVSAFASRSDFRTTWTLVDQYQSHLDTHSVEGLLCAQHWLRNEMKASLQDESVDSFSTIFTGMDLIKAVDEGSKCKGNLSHPSSRELQSIEQRDC